jgi:hypothetical protein
MVDTASITIPYVGKLMNSRPWYNCVPDANHIVVSAGYGTSGTVDYITCTREATGKTVMAYIPQDSMTPTVALTNISGSTANAWWYNPSTGAATSIGSYSTTGTKTFTPPDGNDWVLVLDDSSQNYPPPGVSSAQGTNSLGIQAMGGDMFRLTVTGIPGQLYTVQFSTNAGAVWQTLGSGTTDPTGKLMLNATGTSSASLYRFWH